MTDLEQEQQAQLMAREIVQKAEQARREAIDVVPQTLFSAGIGICCHNVIYRGDLG